MVGRLIALGLVAACCLSGESFEPSRKPLCQIEPTYLFYDVEGDSPEEIRASMLERGPKDVGGKARFAYTDWHISWRWGRTESGQVNTGAVTLECAAEVLLPRLRPKASTSVSFIRAWHEYVERMRAHELKHVEHVSARAPEIVTRLREASEDRGGLSTTHANRVVTQVVNRIKALDRAYDRDTNHGQTEGIWSVQRARVQYSSNASRS